MSIWAVANALPIPQSLTLGSDLVLPSGSSTQILQSTAFIAPAGATVYPWIYSALAVLMGATPPTALQFTCNIPGVTTFLTFIIAPALLVANATFMISFLGFGVPSRFSYAGAGAGVGVSGQPTTQNCTIKQVGTICTAGLALGPDV